MKRQDLDLKILNSELETLTAEEVLESLSKIFDSGIALSMSLQVEDVTLLDMLHKLQIPVKVYSLDTGRLHKETYQMIDTLRFKYNKEITIYFPDHEKVEQMTTKKGMYSFKESLENRHECCGIRKVEPNQRALKDVQLWITGIRRDMSADRADTPIIQWDDNLSLYKCAPLANLTRDQVHAYAKQNNLPMHPLYSKGYLSIGCEPCTRAVQPGEDERAGRWWWENSEHKECGLHFQN